MNKDSVKYKTFQNLCDITGSNYDKMRDMISESARRWPEFFIKITNKNSGQKYRMNVSQENAHGEYFVELFEILDEENIVVMKNIIRTTKPVYSRKTAGVSPILGVIILLAVAASAGSAFFFTSTDMIDDTYITVDHARVYVFGENINSAYLEIGISSSVINNMAISGDIDEIPLVTNWDGSSKNIDPDTGERLKSEGVAIFPTRGGLTVTYEGVVNLSKNVEPGDHIVINIIYDDDIEVTTPRVMAR